MRHLPPLLLFCLAAAAQQPPIDFSYAGYGGGGVALPVVRGVLTVEPTGGDNTALLQGAIDAVAAQPTGAGGFRGAVVLRGGRYRVAGRLRIGASGVVLAGGQEAATLLATGTGRRTLIEIGGTTAPTTDAPVRVTDEIVPAGGRTFTLETVGPLKTGDRVVIVRPSTAEWIAALGMTGLPGSYASQRLDWAPGSRNLVWDRTVTAVDAANSRITVDAPITTALERRYGGGTMARVVAGEPVTQVGIEALTVESDYDQGNDRDEDHAWTAIALDHVEDAWVHGVVARYFAGSAVRVGPRARRVSIVGSHSRQPISEPAGYRRQSFLVEGQQVLVHKCTAEKGMNDFASGLLAAGPNVFLDSEAREALGPSGPFESWASGVLYERVIVRVAGIRLTSDVPRAQGAGWTAANSAIWNCPVRWIEAKGPEGAQNLVKAAPGPLYESQLAARTHATLAAPGIPARNATRLRQFTLPGTPRAAPTAPAATAGAVEIVNGRFVAGGRTLWGPAVNEGWWRGQEVPASALEVAGVSITRWMPGRTGPGLTEDLPALAARMLAEGTPFYQSIPGLWYDRRRDEHSTVGPRDGNVWAPFYEMPWARSGKETAWDGLSKFDLTAFNPWYYGRLREFGELCDRHGLVFHHNLYNTHNLLEIPPHWVDYPWRPANNVNRTGLPEPPPIEADGRIHLANQVYDVRNPLLRSLHRAFLLHELDELGALHNLFFSLGAQFAGPLEFQEFFQDTVAEWEKKTGRRARVELATSKDITDAIMANPARASQVAAIDMRYWQYRPDGTLWAPEGGRNLAFREAIARDFGRNADQPPDTTPYQVYRQVREYRDRYPKVAIVAWNGGAGPIPVLMAGGAQALMRNPSGGQSQGAAPEGTPLDAFVRQRLAGVLMRMTPRDGVTADAARAWCLADEGGQSVLLYSLAGESIELAKPLAGSRYTGLWFDPRTGDTHPLEGTVGMAIRKPTPEAWLLWLTEGR